MHLAGARRGRPGGGALRRSPRQRGLGLRVRGEVPKARAVEVSAQGAQLPPLGLLPAEAVGAGLRRGRGDLGRADFFLARAVAQAELHALAV